MRVIIYILPLHDVLEVHGLQVVDHLVVLVEAATFARSR